MNSRVRIAVLISVLAGLVGLYFYLNPGLQFGGGTVMPIVSVDRSAALTVDEETKAQIRRYFEGVAVLASENNLNAAISLDHSVGRPQVSQGKYKEAYRTYQKVLAISYGQGSLMGVGIALNMMADAAYRANNLPDTLHATLLAYKVAKAMNNKEEIGVMELSFAERLKHEDPVASRMWLLRARESLKGTRYKEDYVRFLVKLPSDLCCTGDRKMGLKPHGEAWELAQSLGDAPAQKWTKWEAGIVYADDLMAQKRPDEAAAVLQKTISFFTPAEKNVESYTNVLHQLGRVNAAQKKDDEARRYFMSAYANYELTRANAPGEEARAMLDKNYKRVVDDFVDLHIQSRDYAAALALLESNKARTLNDIMEDPARKQVYSRWKEMESRQAKEVADMLQGDKDELLPQKGIGDFTKIIALAQKQDEERRKLQADLNLQDVTVTRSLSKQDVENIQRRMSPDMAALSFFVRSEGASVFVISGKGIRHVQLQLERAEFLHSIEQMRVALTNPYNDFYREPARALFAKLFAPALKTLPASVKIIVYSPDGILSRIPLAALMDGESYAGERYAFYAVPSLRYATSVAAVKAPPAESGISCVDPEIYNGRLPFQQETGQALKKLYGEKMTLLAGKECSERKLVAALRQNKAPAFLHIGAHGNFYSNNAMDSAIFLSPDEGDKMGATQAWNVKSMATVDMSRLDLVTLSSCESGLTDQAMPRDVFGIARGLFYAGARRIVAPLWIVQDQSTAEFMQAFHRAYAEKQPAVLSLQRAQQSLMQTAQYRHPYYWSAFVLTGAAR